MHKLFYLENLLEKPKNKKTKKFCFLLTYSYLCPRYEIRNTLAQTNGHL